MAGAPPADAPAPGTSVRAVCFTAFPPVDESAPREPRESAGTPLKDVAEVVMAATKKTATWQYTVMQWERAPTTKRLHLQGYTVFKKPIKFSTAMKLFDGIPSHLEKRYGTHAQARDYCMKEESRARPWCASDTAGPFFDGVEPAEPGAIAEDMKEWLKRIKETAVPDHELIEEDPDRFRKYFQVIARYRASLPSTLRPKIDVFVYWGASRTGKSTRAAKEAGPDACFKPGGLWWDTYTGQDAVVINEFDPEAVPCATLLQWLDGQPYHAPVKHGHAAARYTRVYLTANTDPRTWYPEAPRDQVRALARRFTKVVHFPGPLGGEGGGRRPDRPDPGVGFCGRRCDVCGWACSARPDGDGE